MKYYGLLTILVFFSSSTYAANCTPKVTDKKVTIEYFDGKGNIVRSETHRVRSKKKYKGLVSNDKAFKELVKDTTGNIKIRSSKLELKSGGMTTKVSKKDGTSLAKIGGCPVSKLKFYKRIGNQKSPFIHRSLIDAVSKVEVQPTSNESNKSQAPINSPAVTEQASSPQTLVASAANTKTNIYVTDKNLNMFTKVIDASARASMNISEGRLAQFSLPPPNGLRYDPVKYDCRMLHWRTAKNPDSIIEKSQKGGFKDITSANIEFIGVEPTNQYGMCAFDEAKITGIYKKKKTTEEQQVNSSFDYGSRHFDSMTVSVVRFRKSYLQTCIDRFGTEGAESACNITTPRQSLPSIDFQISSEEKNRLGLRSANHKTGYWKAGFTPNNAESLTGGRKVKLMNINMHNDRGELYFESIAILE